MNKKLLFLISIVFPMQLNAQALELSLDDALNLAYKNNKELQVQKVQVESAERKSNNSWNSILPSLSIGASDTVNVPSEENINSLSVEASASVNFKSDYFELIKKSKTDLEIEKINYELAFYEVHQSVSEVFFELLGLKNQLEIKVEASKNLQEIYNENKSKYEKGFLSEIEYLSSKILYEKSKAEVSQLELEYEQRLSFFKQSLGFLADEKVLIKADIGKILEEYEVGFKNHKSEIEALLSSFDFLEIRLLGNQKLSAEQNVKAKKLETWGPEFNLSYNGGPIFPPANPDKQFQFNNSITASVSLPLDNLISKSQSRQEILDCQDEVKTVELQLEAKKQNLQLELKNQLKQIYEQNEVLKTYGRFVEITEKNFKLCQKSYSRGLLDFQSLKNAQREYLEAKIEFLEKEIELLKVYGAVEKITAGKIR